MSSRVIRVPCALPSASAIAARRFASGMLTVCAEVERGVIKKSTAQSYERENENVLCFGGLHTGVSPVNLLARG